jgi:hypothetical protein
MQAPPPMFGTARTKAMNATAIPTPTNPGQKRRELADVGTPDNPRTQSAIQGTLYGYVLRD